MIIKKLKPFVTSFSEAIMTQYEHGTEVCVGGEVTHVVDTSQFLSDELKADPIAHPGIYLVLDDGVGLNYVVAPKQACEKFESEHGPLKGQIVLAVGKVMKLDLKHKNKVLRDHPEQTKRIAAYFLGPVPELNEE